MKLEKIQLIVCQTHRNSKLNSADELNSYQTLPVSELSNERILTMLMLCSICNTLTSTSHLKNYSQNFHNI
jgi:hypothetical protein